MHRPFFSLLTIWITQTQSLQFTEFDDSTNMLFMNTQNISIANTFKTIEFQLETVDLFHDPTIIEQNIKTITALCTNITDENCRFFERYVEQNKNIIMKPLKFNIRKKRSIDFFEAIKIFPLRKLPNINQRIANKLHIIDKQNRNLTSKHILINNDTLATEQNLFNELTEIIKSLNERLSRIEDRESQFKMTIDVHSMIQATITAIQNNNEVSDKIINILFNNDIANIIEIIRLANIEQLINKLNHSLGENERLFSNNLIEILKIAKIKTKFSSSHDDYNSLLEIQILIPISTNNETWQSFEVISLPFKKGNGLLRIDAENKNVILNSDSNETFTVSNGILEKCRKLNDRHLICFADDFLYTVSQCEIDIFLNKKTNACKFEQVLASAHVTRIDSNIFYCTIKDKITITIHCNHTIAYEIAHNTWFKLDPGCKLNVSDHLFYVPIEEKIEETKIHFAKSVFRNFSIEQILNHTISNNDHTLSINEFTIKLNSQYEDLKEQLKSLYLDSVEEIAEIELAEEESNNTFLLTIIEIVICLILLRIIFGIVLRYCNSAANSIG